MVLPETQTHRKENRVQVKLPISTCFRAYARHEIIAFCNVLLEFISNTIVMCFSPG